MMTTHRRRTGITASVIVAAGFIALAAAALALSATNDQPSTMIPYVGSFATVLSDSYANIVVPGVSAGGTGRSPLSSPTTCSSTSPWATPRRW